MHGGVFVVKNPTDDSFVIVWDKSSLLLVLLWLFVFSQDVLDHFEIWIYLHLWLFISGLFEHFIKRFIEFLCFLKSHTFFFLAIVSLIRSVKVKYATLFPRLSDFIRVWLLSVEPFEVLRCFFLKYGPIGGVCLRRRCIQKLLLVACSFYFILVLLWEKTQHFRIFFCQLPCV